MKSEPKPFQWLDRDHRLYVTQPLSVQVTARTWVWGQIYAFRTTCTSKAMKPDTTRATVQHFLSQRSNQK